MRTRQSMQKMLAMPGQSLAEAPQGNRFATWRDLLERARHCPSPHNVQPWKLELVDENRANLFIDGKRTFPWTDATGSFIISAMSMFTSYLGIAAQNRGFRLEAQSVDLDELLIQRPLSLFAKLTLHRSPELPPHHFTDEDLVCRKTSRKENLKQPIPQSIIDEIGGTARQHNHRLYVIDDQKTIDTVLRLDILALFGDLNHREYFGELKPYIKIGDRDRELDGLHYRVMNLPRLQLAFMKHFPRALKILPLASLARSRYRKQLGHCERLGFLCGKFWKRNDALQAGRMLIKMWLTLGRNNLHLHPFGNLVTNVAARKDVENLVGIEDVWFVFRFGYTEMPEKSNRLAVDQLLLDRVESKITSPSLSLP